MSLLVLFGGIMACGGNASQTADSTKAEQPASTEAASEHGVGPAAGIDWQDGPMDPKLAALGQEIYDVKCAACHSLGDNKVVGPGWKGVTARRTPQWILNMVTNTEEMLNKDPEAQKQMEECMVRMPNQNLTMVDAKNIFEFMRKNDGVK